MRMARVLTNPYNQAKYPNVYEGYQYAQGVVSGEIVACVYIVGACRRFLKDLKDSEDNPQSRYVFDWEYAERYLKLVQKFEHYIGVWNTPEILYQPWQKWVWANALGFKHRQELRRPKYRTLHIEVSRGAAKTTMASQCALYFLGLEKDRAGEKLAVFARKNEQARLILDGARSMARKSQKYLKASGVRVLAHKLVSPLTDSEMVAMSSDSKSMDGLNLRVAFCDELHAMTKELFEVIVSGMKKRSDSLVICLTTAGFNNDGIGYSQSQYAKRIATGDIDDDTFFSAVYTVDEGDDIFTESAWKKANPNYGVSVDPISFEATANKVRHVPSDLANFKVKSLNIWLSEANAFFDLNSWDKCFDPDFKIEDFKREKCYVGIDLASKVDLTSNVYIFRKMIDGLAHYYLYDRTYIPEETARDAKSTLYDDAIARGYLLATPGEAINYPRIEREFIELGREFEILAAHFDPWQATQFAQRLIDERFNMVEFRMTTANLSEPTKTLDALIREKRIHHNGSPLMRWCIGNVVAKEDANGNVYPRKSHEKLKIDIAIALLMGLAGWVNSAQEESVYSSRGILVL